MSEIVDNIEYELKGQMESFDSICAIINPEKLLKEIKEQENHLAENPDIWNDPKHAAQINRDLQRRKQNLEKYNNLNSCKEELNFSIELYREDNDSSLIEEISGTYNKFCDLLKKANLQFLLNGEFDANSAILTIHPGAGGTESCDWASMLYRMYQRFCERMGFKWKELDFQPGDVAGIKSVTAQIEGDYAYGYFKSEAGVHRLVRISPFDSSSRRHTSFASVDVSPEIDDEIEIEVEDKDLRIDTYCSSGAGGQSVNTTYSAVRITHNPSGVVVTCQNERSQLSNRQTAMKILKSRLFQLELQKRQEEALKNQAEKMEIGWGSQIRSYVLHPYQMVKDHRTNFDTSGTEKVLDGELDDFALEYLKWSNIQK
jgi:peptide chain release factor 2